MAHSATLSTHRLCTAPDCYDYVKSVDICQICLQQLCDTHSSASSHRCDKLEHDEWVTAVHIQNQASAYSALVKLAASDVKMFALSQYPSAESCTLVLPKAGERGMQGGQNIHVPVEFDDGKRWVARAKLQRWYSSSAEWQVLHIDSEVATLQFLHRIAPELVPNAWNPRSGVKDSLRYFLMEYVEGAHLQDALTMDVPRQVLKDYAAFMVKVASHPFEGIGSLHTDYTAPTTAATIGPVLTLGTPVYPSGPFSTSREYYLFHINASLESFEQDHAGFIITSDQIRQDTYLLQLYLRRLVNSWQDLGKAEPTYLMHGDPSLDTLLVRPDGSLAGIIDWEFAYTLPFADAFSTTVFTPSHAFRTKGNALFKAEIELCEELEQLGRPDLARCITGGRKYLRLRDLLGCDVQEWTLPRIRGLHEAFGDCVPETLDEWRQLMLSIFSNDEDYLRFSASLEGADDDSDC